MAMNAPWYRAIAVASLWVTGACTGDVTEDPSITGSSSGGDASSASASTGSVDSSGGTGSTTGPGTTGPGTTGADTTGSETHGTGTTVVSDGSSTSGVGSGTTDGSTGAGSGSDTTTRGDGSATGSSGDVGTGSSGDVGTGSSGDVGTGSSGDVGMGSSGGSDGGAMGTSGGSDGGAMGTSGGSDGAGTSGGIDTAGLTEGGGSSSDGGTSGGMMGELPIFTESFDGNDGDPWPSPWMIVGDNVLSATIQNGRGELSGITGGTARIVLPGFDLRDAEMYASIEFTDWNSQGFGLYARQNGGSLDQTDPPGQGYALFLEGFYLQSLGIWHEVAGIETLSSASFDPIPGGLQPGTVYRMRYQVLQLPGGTQLRGKVWLATDPEPTDWFIDILDTTPELQDATGSFAVDLYNWAGVESVWVDDVEIYAL